MRTYKHWLLIDGAEKDKFVSTQWLNLKNFFDKYPESKITVYNKTYGSIFHKVFCLEVDQKYNDLDLDCNSFFDGSLKRLPTKPKDIETTLDFILMFEVYFNKEAFKE